MLAAETLLLDSLRLTDAKLEARLTDGLLELTRFTADSYGGALSVTGRADARDPSAGLQLAADLTASEVDVKGLLRDLAEIDRFSGPVTLESRLTTRGTSQAALVAGLAGAGPLAGQVPAAGKGNGPAQGRERGGTDG